MSPPPTQPTPPRTYLDSLTLRNFRCFRDITIPFDPHLTVLVAPNGGGKTAILDAIALVLQSFTNPILGEDIRGIAESDFYLELGEGQIMKQRRPVFFGATCIIEGKKINWEREQEKIRRGPPGRVDNLKKEAQKFAKILQSNESSACTLPLISYYGTGRLHDLLKLTKQKVEGGTLREKGYQDSLSSLSGYKFFEDWFERFSRDKQDEESEQKPSPYKPKEKLKVVQDVINIVLEPVGWKDVKWDFPLKTIVAFHSEFGKLPVRWLSAGIRTTLGLVGDIAYRCHQLNPYLNADAAAKTPGIVLIDEVDLHLHPQWQQTILPSLQEAFPQIQFIVTTHSPILVQSANNAKIILLEDEDGQPIVRDGLDAIKNWRIDQILTSELFNLHSIYNVAQSALIAERTELLSKRDLTPDDEVRIKTINDELSKQGHLAPGIDTILSKVEKYINQQQKNKNEQ